MKKLKILLFLIVFAFVSCNGGDSNDATGREVYALFTNPGGTSPVHREAVRFIRNAEKTIDLKAFLLDDADITNSLTYANGRGVLVRVVCDDENADNVNFNRLRNNGIEVVQDGPGGGAHNKTMIIDSIIVWAGSTNFTHNGFFSNNNNALVINSRELALEYLHDFQQMFDGRFQGRKVSNGVKDIEVDGSLIRAYFSPQDNPEDMLRQRVQNAQESIDLAIYAFTLNYITNDFIDAHRRGVVIRAIFDSLLIAQGVTTKFDDFVGAGIDARRDPARFAFHHKFMIVDGQEVVVSSANYTVSGIIHNDENFVWIQGGEVIDDYQKEFDRWWQKTNRRNRLLN